MFSKLRLDKCYNYNNNEKENQNSYTQRSISRKMAKEKLTYSEIHRQTKRNLESKSQYEVQWAPKFLFQGFINKFHEKAGQGIVFLNNGTLVIGNWVKGYLHGQVLIFTPFTGIIVCNYINGKLNGWSISLFSNKIIIITHYFEDKIDGERIIFQESQKLWVASKYTEYGKFLSITHVENGTRDHLPSFVDSEQLQELFQEIIKRENYMPFCSKIKEKKITKMMKYVGFFNEDDEPQGLGVLYTWNQFYVGNFKSGSLEHIGRVVYPNGQVYQGQMSDGDFSGNGVFFNPAKNQSTIIQSNPGEENEILEKVSGYMLIDFNVRLGSKIRNVSLGFEESGFKEQLDLLQKYYYSYFIELKMREEVNCSIEQNYSLNKKQPEEVFFSSQVDEKYNTGKNWLAEEFEGLSEKDEKEVRKIYSQTENRLTPKEKKNNLKNFQSLQINENMFPSSGQKYKLSSPKSIYKKQMFSSSLLDGKSSEMTFRLNNLQGQKPIKIEEKKVKQVSQKDSEGSMMTSKIKSIMKKGNYRKKIFDV